MQIMDEGREMVTKPECADFYATILLCLWRSGESAAWATRQGFRVLALGLTLADEWPESDEEMRRLDDFIEQHSFELDHVSCEALERHRGAVRQYPFPGCALCGVERAWNGRWVIPVEEQARRFGGAKIVLVRMCADCANDPDVDQKVEAVISKNVQVQ